MSCCHEAARTRVRPAGTVVPRLRGCLGLGRARFNTRRDLAWRHATQPWRHRLLGHRRVTWGDLDVRLP